ncbi:MAG: 2-oxoacid ferredoxin oxidoreductase, partial [Thermoplasmataceae archaeon]
FFRKRVYKPEMDTKNFAKAYEMALQWGDKIPIGIFYDVDEETYEDRSPIIGAKSLIDQPPYQLKPEDLAEFL